MHASPTKNRASSKAVYDASPTKKRAQMRAHSKSAYAASPTKQRASSKAAYDASPTKKRAQMRAHSKSAYAASPTKKRASSKAAYDASPTKKRAQMRAHSKSAYAASPTKKRASSKAAYDASPTKKRAQMRAHSKSAYAASPTKQRASSKAAYDSSPTKKRALMRAYSKKDRASRSGAQLKAQRARCRKYYTKNAAAIRASLRARRALAEPKADVVATYVTSVERSLFHDEKAKLELADAFQQYAGPTCKAATFARAVCKVAARRLVNKALEKRKDFAGCLIKTTRVINGFTLKGEEDFGDCGHCASSEPYFYDTAYHLVKRGLSIPVDQSGKCVVAEEILSKQSKPGVQTEASKGSQHEASQVPKPTRWKCTSECKALTPSEVEAVVELKQSFEKPMKELRDALDSCDDGCPNGHYSVRDLDWVCVGQFGSVGRLGHPLVCSNDGGCTSKLRILRAASTHFRKLRKFLFELHSAIRSHVHVAEIDQHLCGGSVKSLMEILKLTEFHKLLSIDVESAYVQPVNADSKKPAYVLSRESQLLPNATAIKAYEKKLRKDPDCACFSCERLFVRSGVSKVKLSDELGSEVWPRLKAFVMKQNKPASSNVVYMCKYCKPRIKSDELPARCVLNGLETVPLPV